MDFSLGILKNFVLWLKDGRKKKKKELNDLRNFVQQFTAVVAVCSAC